MAIACIESGSRTRPRWPLLSNRGGLTMAHELFPKADQQALSFDEVIRRLRAAFAHVQLDTARASRELEESAQYMARTGRPHFDREDVDRARRLIGRAAYVIVADDPNLDGAYLSFLLEPDHEKI